MAKKTAPKKTVKSAPKAEVKITGRPRIEGLDIFECVQGDAEWHKLRSGIITASKLSAVMASGKDGGDSAGREKLLQQMVGERLTGIPAETFSSYAMNRGKEMEPRAREHYAANTFAKIRQVGFVRRTLKFQRSEVVVGCSPDALVGDAGGLEIKTMAPDLLIAQMLRGLPPTEHRQQIHGTIFFADLDWVDLQLYYDDMPVQPKYRFERDEVYNQQIADAVEVFDYDLRQLEKRIRAMG